MSSFARTAGGDLDFSSHGLVVVTDPVQCAAWELEDRLALTLGEWVYDTSQGVPYFTFMGVKNPPIKAITNMFRSIILGVQPIQAVSISVQFNRRTRSLAYNFVASCQGGRTITGGSGQPFVVSTPVGQ